MLIVGFGCTVPAIMAARSLENQRDRRLTIMITPFMSCGARMPIYAFFAAIFFPTHKGLVTFSMYVLGVIVAILSAVVLSKTVLRGSEAPFIIELPPYRLPDTKSLFLHIWDKVQDFIIGGSLIFAMSVVIWIFRTFTLTFPSPRTARKAYLACWAA
jgi:ferrous iron transport protein B